MNNNEIEELYVGYVVEPEKGYDYFTEHKLFNDLFGVNKWYCNYWGIGYKTEYHHVKLDPKYIKYKILFEKPKNHVIKEILTGVEFHEIIDLSNDMVGKTLDNWNKYTELLNHPNYGVPITGIKPATNEDIEEYIKKHKNVDKYKENLETYKEKRESIKQFVLECEEQERLEKERAEEAKNNTRKSLINKIVNMRKTYNSINNNVKQY